MTFGKVFIITAIALVGIFGLGTEILATTHGLETVWPQSPNGINLTGTSTLTDLIAYLYGWMIAIGGLIAFIIIVIAGFQYLTSSGNPTKTQDAKDKILSAVTGLILLLSTVIILNVLNPELTKLHYCRAFSFYFNETILS